MAYFDMIHVYTIGIDSQSISDTLLQLLITFRAIPYALCTEFSSSIVQNVNKLPQVQRIIKSLSPDYVN